MAGRTDVSRRSFIRSSASLFAAVGLDPGLGRFLRAQPKAAGFPRIKVSGSNYEIGLAIGRRFKTEIGESLKRRGKEFEKLKETALGDGARLLNGFREALKKRFPGLLEEIRGTAEGAGVRPEDLLVWNCRPEIDAVRQGGSCGGCTTICVCTAEDLFVAHNEDGHRDDADLLYLTDVTPPSGVRFVSLSYPGILPGNGPTMNAAGVVQTTNFIGASDFRIGVPRYAVNRASAEARSVDDALAVATDPARAYSFHNIFAQKKARRALSVEVTHDRAHSIAVTGVYVHTNHLIHKEMEGIAQIDDYVKKGSTHQRFEAAGAALKAAARVDRALTLKVLSSHKGAPKSICRHPEGERTGTTVACAILDVTKGAMKLSRGQPCAGSFENVRI
jgi:hypothetical protein